MSGIKNVIKWINYNFKPLWLPFLGLVFLSCTNLFLFHMEYLNYKDKYEMAAIFINNHSMKNPSQLAAELFKKQDTEINGYGLNWLNENGYPFHYKSSYYLRYQTNVRMIIIISVFLYLLILLALWYSNNTEMKKRKSMLHRLEQIFSNVRNGKYDYSEQEPDVLLSEDGRFLMELNSFLCSYQMKEEEVKQEKEGVKSIVSNISHQLKTPFAALITTFEILKRDDLKEENRQEFFLRYGKQLDAIEQLLNALIQISRLENGMIEIIRKNSCLFDTILEAVNRIYIRAEENNISIELEAEEELQILKIPHDRKWLCEAILNILENAVKYSCSNTKITIRMDKLITFLRIEIEDQGIGIPKEEYHKIFQRFYRGEDIAVKNLSGSGIGLYLSREIISKHNGTVSVISCQEEKNKGSKFILQLPLRI